MHDPYDHIEDYLAGALSAEEMAAFDAAMRSDGMLQQAVKDFEFIALIGEALVEQDISAIVEDELAVGSTGLSEIQDNNAPKRRWLTRVLLLCGFGLLLVAGWYIGEKSSRHAKVNYADLVVPPVLPRERTDMVSDADRYVLEYFSGDKKNLDSLRLSSDPIAEFWMVEIFMSEMLYDSVIHYTESISPTLIRSRKDKMLYNRIISYLLSGREAEAYDILRGVPDDFDDYYIERLPKPQ